MRKKVLSIILSVSMCMTVMVNHRVFAEDTNYDKNGFAVSNDVTPEYQEPTLNDNGTADDSSDDYYEIVNAGNLYWFGQQVNSGNSKINAVLNADITINEKIFGDDGEVLEDTFLAWSPIGIEYAFEGTFDGNEKTINGLYFNDTDTDYVGLFGYNSGMITGVKLSNSYIKAKKYVGGICGYNYSGGNIEECSTEKSVISGSEYVGGISGGNSNIMYASDYEMANIYNSYNASKVEGGREVGGICGGSEYGEVRNCYNTGEICVTYSDGGGICGVNTGNIIRCYNLGEISSTDINGSCIGGICGYNYNFKGTITNCYNEGSVSGEIMVGGICGFNYKYNEVGRISNCYNIGKISGTSQVGGICGENSEDINNTIIINCYYLDDCNADGTVFDATNSTAVTAERLKSGEICWLLNGSTADTSTGLFIQWRQNIDNGQTVDEYPKLTGGIVYYYGDHKCKPTEYDYTNLELNHNYKDGVCTGCGKVLPAEVVTEENYEKLGLDESYIGYYAIEEAYQLYWVAGLINGTNDDSTGVMPSVNAVLINDIVINENLLESLEYDENGNVTNGDSFKAWTPMGITDFSFSGIFDGNGKTISGLYFNDAEQNNIGLFGYNTGTIKDVGIIDSYFCGNEQVGAVCGYNAFSGMINKCYNEGSVVEGNRYIGGICGYNYIDTTQEGYLRNCYNTGSVSGNEMVGGISGYSYEIGRISSCYNIGVVSGKSNVSGVCGGTESVQSDMPITGPMMPTQSVSVCYLEGCNGEGTVFDSEFDVGKPIECFESGEICHAMQSSVYGEPEVWGQDIVSENKDKFPKFTSNEEERVVRVQFCTSMDYGYAMAYTNVNHTVNLPNPPENSDVIGFFKWAQYETDDAFTSETPVTGDIMLYSYGQVMYGVSEQEKIITVDYGNGLKKDLSEYMSCIDGTMPMSGLFSYDITGGNDKLGAVIEGDMLIIPETAETGTYTISVKAETISPQVSLMSVEYNAQAKNFDITIIINEAPNTNPKIVFEDGVVKVVGNQVGQLIIVGFDELGFMVKVDLVNGYEAELTGYEGCTVVRAFLVEDMDTIKPLCEAEESNGVSI